MFKEVKRKIGLEQNRRGNTVFVEKIRIRASPPFSFDLSARIFSGGDRQIRTYENGKFWQVMRVEDTLFLFAVSSTGTVDKPRLLAELRSTKEITESDKTKAKEKIVALFNLDFDLRPFYDEVKNDQTMARITERLRGLKSPTTATVFEALVDSVVEQQISLKVANSIEKRLIKRFGDTLDVNSTKYYSYPTPQRLASVETKEFRNSGLSQRKAEYLKEISTLVAEGQMDLDKIKQYEKADDIIRELDSVRGIGVWTAELTMIRGMKKLEALPADDLGLRRVISQYYCDDNKITSYQARQIAENWGKWKGLAAYYLVMTDMMKIEV